MRLNGLTSVNTTGGGTVTSFSANTAYRLNNSATLATYVPTNSTGADGLIGKPSPTGTFDAVGIMSQYTSTTAGTTGGYQLLNRKYADFIQGNTPNLTSSPVPTNISTTGFTVSFKTQNAGDTQLLYSTSPTLPTASTTTLTNTAQVTEHGLAITGLQPATVYYVQAVSVNATGRSESRVTPMITASLSSGRMQTYFTNSVDNTLALPNNNAIHCANGRIADTLAAYIGRAQQTLDITIYNWNNNVILNAVNAAHARGVRVRVIYEDDNNNFSVPNLTAGIPRVFRPAGGTFNTTSIMHNKFVVIDANSTNPNLPMVWTGSTNWTAAQLSTDPNNAITVQDQSLARVYTMEFEEMWGSSTATPGTTRLFGSRKTDNTPHYLLIGGKRVESWFSPTDNVNSRLLETVRTADFDLHVLSMLVTRSDVGRALADQVTQRNIAACSDGLTNDTSGVAGFVFRSIRAGMGTRYLLDRLPGIMHHKTLIVDASAPHSDPTVFVGSHNWTASADIENDENTLVIHDNLITNQYYQEYAARIAAQNQGITACRLALATRTGTVQASTMQAYPNPTRGSFQLHLASTSARTATVVLRDATGRVVLERTQPYNGTDLTVDATSLKSGLYLVQVTTPETTQVSRVVVE
ncbi:phospholipase D-like domain-containing protein [Hymenobacter sp. B1770]|uniref:phospholipase D-like domain-containing protein n=1 Tax=Hymenobacter sp. B1770 TaxID=1718788 RepID=UPI003CF847A9